MPTLDIDVTHAEAAEAIEDPVRELFGDDNYVLVRIDQPPKRAIPFRTFTPFRKITRTFTAPDDSFASAFPTFLFSNSSCCSPTFVVTSRTCFLKSCTTRWIVTLRSTSSLHAFLEKTDTAGGPSLKCKGTRVEQALVRMLLELGLVSARMPQSGAVGREFAGDIHLELRGHLHRFEVEARREFRTLHSWLAGADLLLLRADRQPPLSLLSLRAKLAGALKLAARP
jgi:hypothetical protein